MKSIIHINQHVIKRNARTGSRDPVITVKTYKGNRYGHSVKIHGPSEVVYLPDDPLKCGARCWIETTSEVTVDPILIPGPKRHSGSRSSCQTRTVCPPCQTGRRGRH